MKLLPLLLPLLAACASTPESIDPVLFAPGAVSTAGPEFATTFARDGRTVFFNTVEEGRILVRAARREGHGWSAHLPLPFSDGTYRDIDPFVTADGRLVFSSDRPRPGAGPEVGDFDLWAVRPDGAGWSEPEPLGSPPNGPEDEIFATFTDTGTVYFSIRVGDEPRRLYRARLEGGRYRPRELVDLGLPPGASAGNPLIAPDESWLVFTSPDLGGAGAVDLFLSQRRPDGGWSQPRPLPPPVNSAFSDFAPGLGPDGETLYFTSERPGLVPAGAVEGRPPGDLYAVPLEPLLGTTP